jgi:hypothetical protein
MDNIERAKAELNEYNRSIAEGKQEHSFTEFNRILERNGCSKEADQMKRGYNGEGGFNGVF